MASRGEQGLEAFQSIHRCYIYTVFIESKASTSAFSLMKTPSSAIGKIFTDGILAMTQPSPVNFFSEWATKALESMSKLMEPTGAHADIPCV